MSIVLEQIFRTPNGAKVSLFVKPSHVGLVPPGYRDSQLVEFRWPAHAWPGAYPLVYLTRDNGSLCERCANENIALTLGDDPQWEIVACFPNWEDPNCFCDHCNKQIEPAYNPENTFA